MCLSHFLCSGTTTVLALPFHRSWESVDVMLNWFKDASFGSTLLLTVRRDRKPPSGCNSLGQVCNEIHASIERKSNYAAEGRQKKLRAKAVRGPLIISTHANGATAHGNGE